MASLLSFYHLLKCSRRSFSEGCSSLLQKLIEISMLCMNSPGHTVASAINMQTLPLTSISCPYRKEPPLMTSFWIAKFKKSLLMFFTGRGFISCRFALLVDPLLLRSSSYLVVSLFTGDPASGIPFFVTSRKRASCYWTCTHTAGSSGAARV